MSRRLVNGMVDGTFALADGVAAFEMAKSKGALKVQFVMTEEQAPAEQPEVQRADGATLAAGSEAPPPEAEKDEPVPK